MNIGNPKNNYTNLFKLYEYDKKDKTSKVFETGGKIGFTLLIISGSLMSGFATYLSKPAHNNLQELLAGCTLVGLVLGLCGFMGLGARVSGQQAGIKGLGFQILRVLWKTFLYLLLPAFMLSAILYFVFMFRK